MDIGNRLHVQEAFFFPRFLGATNDAARTRAPPPRTPCSAPSDRARSSPSSRGGEVKEGQGFQRYDESCVGEVGARTAGRMRMGLRWPRCVGSAPRGGGSRSIPHLIVFGCVGERGKVVVCGLHLIRTIAFDWQIVYYTLTNFT